MSFCSVTGCGVTDRVQEHHLSYDPEIKVFLCKKHHEGLHGHGVGKGSGYESAASYPNERLDESPPGLFRLKRGSQGHYYLPRTLQRVVGGSVLGHTMGFAAVLWNEEALLIDVIESVDIIGRSLRLQGSLLNF